MHELSLCQNIIDQLRELARQHDAASVSRLEVQVGVLSGVEPQLLEQAFLFAKAGTLAEHAVMRTELVQPRVACLACGAETAPAPWCGVGSQEHKTVVVDVDPDHEDCEHDNDCER